MAHFQYLIDSGLGEINYDFAAAAVPLLQTINWLTDTYLQLANTHGITLIIDLDNELSNTIEDLENYYNHIDEINRPRPLALLTHDIIGRIIVKRDDACNTYKAILEAHRVPLGNDTIQDFAIKGFQRARFNECFIIQRLAIENLQRE